MLPSRPGPWWVLGTRLEWAAQDRVVRFQVGPARPAVSGYHSLQLIMVWVGFYYIISPKVKYMNRWSDVWTLHQPYKIRRVNSNCKWTLFVVRNYLFTVDLWWWRKPDILYTIISLAFLTGTVSLIVGMPNAQTRLVSGNTKHSHSDMGQQMWCMESKDIQSTN